MLEAEASSTHAACDLVRIPEGATLDGAGIVRALVLASDEVAPDPIPPAWLELSAPPFAAYEEAEPGSLPLELASAAGDVMRIEEVSPSVVAIAAGGAKAEVPRYWLARMLHRVALHGLRLGYAETYGGFFVDDRPGEEHGDELVRLGVRGGTGVAIPRSEAAAAIERMYRAVAPPGYRERPT